MVKKISIPFFVLITLLCGIAAAQPEIIRQRCLGGTAWDQGSGISRSSDGGFFAGGITYSYDGSFADNHGNKLFKNADGWIAKIGASEAQDVVLWKHCFGDSLYDDIQRIAGTTDGGCIAIGYTSFISNPTIGYHGGNDVVVIKLNSIGTVEWKRCYGGSGSDIGTNIIQTKDGGYFFIAFTGSKNGDITDTASVTRWMVKLSATGTIEWQKKYRAAYNGGILQTADGGYLISSIISDSSVAGYHGSEDALLIKTDSVGTIAWKKCYGGSQADALWNIVQTPDGGYMAAGSTASIDGDAVGLHDSLTLYNYGDAWLVKLNDTGKIEWQHCYGGKWVDIAAVVLRTSDGNFIMVGISNSNDADVSGNHNDNYPGVGAYVYDLWILKVDSIGTLLWQQTIGGSANDQLGDAALIDDNTIVLTGITNSVDGDITSNTGFPDSNQALIMKLSTGNSGVEKNREAPETLQIPATIISSDLKFICPTSQGCSITLYDVLGKELLHQKQPRVVIGSEVTVNMKSFASGVYVLKVEDGSKVFIQKIIKR